MADDAEDKVRRRRRRALSPRKQDKLSFDEAELLGFDGTGRFDVVEPVRWGDLTADQQAAIKQARQENQSREESQ